MERKAHWQSVWRGKTPDTKSWYQPVASTSLELIERVAPDRDTAIIDVGGGASRLVDSLLETGYTDITVLDIADDALAASRGRLGARAEQVTWIACDIADCEPERNWDLWHDRALFHFLIDAVDRKAYLNVLKRSLGPGGWCILATFSLDGPDRCSGLRVRRYDEERLLTEFGDGFELRESRRETHLTPAGATQEFIWFVLKYR